MKKKYAAPQTIVIVAETGCLLAGSGKTINPMSDGTIRTYGAQGDAFSSTNLGVGTSGSDKTFEKGQGSGGAGNRSKSGSLWDDWE